MKAGVSHPEGAFLGFEGLATAGRVLADEGLIAGGSIRLASVIDF